MPAVSFTDNPLNPVPVCGFWKIAFWNTYQNLNRGIRIEVSFKEDDFEGRDKKTLPRFKKRGNQFFTAKAFRFAVTGSGKTF